MQTHAVLARLLLHPMATERRRKRGLDKHVTLGNRHVVQQWLQVAKAVLEGDRGRRDPVATGGTAGDLSLLQAP